MEALFLVSSGWCWVYFGWRRVVVGSGGFALLLVHGGQNFLGSGGRWCVFFGWWWVMVCNFWVVVGGGGYILGSGSWWWLVVSLFCIVVGDDG